MNKILCMVYFAVGLLLISGIQSELFGQRDQRQQRGIPPEEAFEEFERKVIALDNYQMTFTVSIEGLVESAIEGTITVRGGERIDLAADGTYDGRRVNVHLHADGTRLTGGTRAETFEAAPPEEPMEPTMAGV